MAPSNRGMAFARAMYIMYVMYIVNIILAFTGAIFVGLRLFGVIEWSWGATLMPWVALVTVYVVRRILR